MCEGGVREKTLLEEIETLDIEDHIKERIKRKYWNEVERHRADMCRVREENDREAMEAKRENIENKTIIHVLASYIREKELL